MWIRCHHGQRHKAAVICRHQASLCGERVGWVENCADPDDLQAWCDDCEGVFARERGKTETFRQFNDFRMVCVHCYAERKAFHSGASI